MNGLRNHAGENNPFFGRRHTKETKRKMSEARKGRHNRGCNIAECYKLLITAVVKQAVKDGEVWFLETEPGVSYCAAVGINPDKFRGLPPQRQ